MMKSRKLAHLFGLMVLLLLMPVHSFAQNLRVEGKVLDEQGEGLIGAGVVIQPADMATAFKVTLPGIDILCQHAVLIEAAHRSASSSHPYILLHVREGAADIEAFFNGNLLLTNSYPAGDSEEVLYHALSVMKHLHLETPDMELAICGLVDRTFFSRMQHFFPNVTLYTGKPYTFLNPDFQTLHTYRHTLILS